MKQFLLILCVILFTTSALKAQDSRGPAPDPGTLVLKLYPNPASTYITFDLQKGYQKGMSITVFNFLGKKIVETPNVTEKTTLMLNDFNRGVYIYYLMDARGKLVDTGKFQVSK